ncbi:iron ABC transporter permease [Peptoniphilus sp. MSJ-1]|uniref:Iron ABC transporter permease n=1 Tax=Peptoniphilus ovalis TaxID=2841503 RepID=A0ABS6FFY4_9FIRM|nr:iron ABC transporter permease [Peptoniphilus ovalis]MBU5668876.1 iron ABC transporter permease [Peptoniphilus ovalis]
MIKNYCVKNGKIHFYVYIILIILPILAALAAVNMGRMEINFKDTIEFFSNLIRNREIDPIMESVILKLRLPRIITAIIVGSGLTVAGITFQSLFSNPLATPDVLGVSSASSLGAIIAILLNLNSFGIQLIALITGLLSIFITIRIIKREESSIIMLVLVGIIISSLSNAFSSLLKYMADPMDKLPQITYWLMGSFGRASYKNLLLAGPIILISSILIYKMRWRLNILSLSEDEIKSLGIDIRKTRFTFILLSTIITASAVSICGQIGWIGLIIPHLARMFVGANNVYTLPFGLSLGASFMVLIEALSRTVSVIELPISILTAIIGAPIFILLLRRTGGSFH